MKHKFTTIVLAGERNANHPLLHKFNVGCKALIQIDGTPMVQRVLDTLAASSLTGKRILSGPKQSQIDASSTLQQIINQEDLTWIIPEPSPSKSAYRAMQGIPSDQSILLTTADHPLLRSDIVDEFCSRSLAENFDATVGLAPYSVVQKAFPNMKKTVLRFRDGEYCGCNLFAFLTPDGRKVAHFWQQVEQQRKNPLRLMQALGWWSVVRYRLGWLTLDQALGKLSKKLGLRLGAIILPYAEAAVDVDSIGDHEIVEHRFKHKDNSD